MALTRLTIIVAASALLAAASSGTPGGCAVAGERPENARGIVSGPPTNVGRMTPSFSDEFNSTTLDARRWNVTFDEPGREEATIAKRSLWSNRERQVYFDPAFLRLGIQPLKVINSVLRIEARPLDSGALAAVRGAVSRQAAKIATSELRNVTYSSGMISTRGRYHQLYGYFEMRARWSAGRGVWPAFWLLPKGGGWPPEIDIVEAHGDKPTDAFQSTHSKVAGDDTQRVQLPAGTGQDFHTYGMLWTARTIDYYIDGVKTGSRPTPGDMHVPMYILANLAMGGSWPGDPDASTPVPAYLEIDFIRAWRFAGAS